MLTSRSYLLAVLLAISLASASAQGYEREEADVNNETGDDDFNYKLPEPYKSVLESGARFALAQASLTRNLDAGLAIEAMNDLAHKLLQTSTLVLLAKVATVMMLGIGASSTIFPDGRQTIESIWKEPKQLRVEYVLSSFAGGNSMKLLSLSGDALISKLGLMEQPCRRLTFCRLGQKAASLLDALSVPRSVRKLTSSLLTDGLSSSGADISALLQGLFDRNCPARSQTSSFCAASLLS